MSERFEVRANGQYEFGVWDHDRSQWSRTGYFGDAGHGDAAARAAELNVRPEPSLNILDLPTTSDGVRAYMVGRVELRVTTNGEGRTRVEALNPKRAAVEGFWLNDTEAIEAFYSEWML